MQQDIKRTNNYAFLRKLHLSNLFKTTKAKLSAILKRCFRTHEQRAGLTPHQHVCRPYPPHPTLQIHSLPADSGDLNGSLPRFGFGKLSCR